MIRSSAGVFFALLLAALAAPAAAQRSGQTLDVFEGVGLEEQLGRKVPLDLVFTDEAGRQVPIGSFLRDDRPVLLNLVYHNCPMLCNLLLDGLTQGLQGMAWTPGREFDVVTVSFSAAEGPDLARRQKERYLAALGRPEAAAGWHFLTGSEASIQALARSVGFQFRWVEETQDYAHPAVLTFLGPDGTITRYLYGVAFEPTELKIALLEASEGKVGTALDQVFLFCYQYDSHEKGYVLHATNLMKAGGALTVLALAAVLAVFWRREMRRHRGGQGFEGAPVPAPGS